jgi:alkanesulfonate monooxygenase SsuD/methylene tetrahydromethanopterin reductase-like flavin-dependent oxidoreductase (luciferase family)
VTFHDAYCRPQPARGTVPIIVGGHSRAAARRAGRIGDGFFPARGAAKELIELARRTAEEHDRDPDALEITTSMPATRAEIADLARLGVGRVLVPVTGAAGSQTTIATPEDALAWRTVLDQYTD